MPDFRALLQQLVSPTQPKQPQQGQTPLALEHPAIQQLLKAQEQPDFEGAVKEAVRRYPWLANLGVPIKLTEGSGPYMSESYDPKAEENPYPGNFTVQLRNKRLTGDPTSWPAALGREGMDYMSQHDPTYQAYAKQFRKMMTPQQLERAQTRYKKEQATGEKRSFEDFLKKAELQEYIGGYVFDMPNWRNAGWTPEQRQLLDKLKSHMWNGQTPTPVNIP